MSSETLKPSHEKTKSAPKTRQLIKIRLISVAVAALFAPFFAMRPTGTRFTSGGQTYYLEKAMTQAAREKGLGGRSSLAENRGMLFVFDTQVVQCFWMKDMQFPLDIIWLDSQKKVTYEVANLSPATYPQSYCGDNSTRYVVELRAGEAKRTGITIGKTLTF